MDRAVLAKGALGCHTVAGMAVPGQGEMHLVLPAWGSGTSLIPHCVIIYS